MKTFIAGLMLIPLALGMLCGIGWQGNNTPISEVAQRATAFAQGEYPDPIRSDVVYVTPFMTVTPTPTITPSGVSEGNIPPAPPADNNDDSPDNDTPNTASNDPPPNPPPPIGGPPTRIAALPPPTAAPVAMAPTNAPPPQRATSAPNNPPPAPPDNNDDNNDGDNNPPPSAPPTDVPATATAPPATATVPPTVPPATATTIPTDPTLPDIAFVEQFFDVAENINEQLITVRLSRASSDPVEVAYRSYDVTASQNADYMPLDGLLTLSPGTTEATFTVTIVDDNVDDPDQEQLQLKLQNPRNVNITTDTAIVQINDNDGPPVLQFSAPSYDVAENQTAVLTVTLSHPSGQFVSMQYNVASETATTTTTMMLPHTDYQPLSFGGLSFGPDAQGLTPTVITFTWTELVDDNIAETDKSLQMELLDPPHNAVLGILSKTLVTLFDDDR